MIGRGNRSTRRKPAPVPLCPPQTPHAARTRTRAAAVGSQLLAAELRHGRLGLLRIRLHGNNSRKLLLLLLLLLSILTAKGFLPGGSGTTIRHNK
jgi:hypothetical protein